MSEQKSHHMWRAGQVGYTLLAAALVAGVVRTLVKAGQDVYDIRPQDVAIAMGAFAVAAAGIVLGWSSRRFGAVVLTMVAVVLVLAAIVSFGAPMLILVVLTASLGLATAGTPDRRVVGAGALLGIGALALALTALSSPLVVCADRSAGGNLSLGSRSGSGTASASAGVDGDIRGQAQGDRYAYSYTCRDGRLVEFTLRRR